MATVRELRRIGEQRAKDEGFDPRDADRMLAHALGESITWMIAHDTDQVGVDPEDLFAEMLRRRSRGEPLQYILGFWEFFGREFRVDDRALIPRPETEHLAEAVIANAPEGGRVLEVGTGSGAIAVSVAAERPDLELVATDISIEALELARQNVSRHQVSVALLVADALRGLQGTFSTIVSNPPYIPEDVIPGLQREVREWEPKVALTPGPDGLRIIDELLGSAHALLGEDGFIVLEMGFSQRGGVQDLAERHGWANFTFVDDLASIPRVAVLRR